MINGCMVGEYAGTMATLEWEQGDGLYSPLQGQTPNDLKTSHKASLPKVRSTSQCHHRALYILGEFQHPKHRT